MTYHVWLVGAIYIGADLLVYAAAGAKPFWWTLFGGLLLVFCITVVEAARRRE